MQITGGRRLKLLLGTVAALYAITEVEYDEKRDIRLTERIEVIVMPERGKGA